MTSLRRALLPLLAIQLPFALASACTTFGGGDPEGDASVPVPDASPSPLDGVAPPFDAGLPEDGAAPGDGGTCATPKGARTPCSSCTKLTVHTIETSTIDGGTGPFTFGVAVDRGSVYWLEQRGPIAYDGVGVSTAIRRKALNAPAAAAATTLAIVPLPFTRLVVTDTTLWLASGGSNQQVHRLPKTCTSNCMPTGLGGAVRATAMVPYRDGIAIATGDRIIAYDEAGADSTTVVNRGALGIAPWAGGLAYVAENAMSNDSIGITDSTTTIPLLAVDPSATKFPRYGATMLASSCDTLWGLQTFRRVRDGGADFHSAIVRSMGVGTNTAGTAFDPLVFGLAADTIHLYAALPNGAGVVRFDPTASLASTPVATAVSAFGVAVDDDYVYFDDHGTNAQAQSVGIYKVKKSK